MSAAQHHAPESDTTRVLVDLGVAAGSLLLVAAWSILAYQSEWSELIDPGLRSALGVLLSLVFFGLAGVTLFFYEEELQGLPLARWATTASGVYFFGCGVWDLLVPLQIPLFPWGYLLFGWVALSASAWSDSVMLALVGAELIDQVLATRIAHTFGFVGGFSSTAVFFHLGVALLELPLGWGLARRYRRSLGLGIVCNAGFTLTFGLLALGYYGHELHNCPEWEWITYLYLLLAFVTSVLIARLIARLGQGGAWDLSSRTVILTINQICVRLGLERQLAWLVGVFGYWALASTGIFEPGSQGPGEGLEITPEMLQDPEQLQALLARLAAQDPGKVRLSRERQSSMVRAFLLGAVGLYGVFALVAHGNQAFSSEEAFRIEVNSPRVEARVRVRIGEVHLPEDLGAGEAMDCYLLPSEVGARSLVFTDLFAVRRGEAPPEGVSPASAWHVRGRSYRNRQHDGRMRRGVLLDQRFDYILGEELAADLEPEDVLVFSQGWAGFVYPSRVIRAGEAGALGAGPEVGSSEAGWFVGVLDAE